MQDFAARLQDALGSAYQIDRELPVGGLGRLFLATEAGTGRRVSVQALPPDLVDRVDVARFKAAMDAVARLKHPGILPLVACGTRDHLVWCVWPHPRGESLRYRLVRDGGLADDEALQVLHDVADALAYGHDHGVYHGDLRPDNIYVENGRSTVAEFGLRSALNAALGSAGGMDAQADVHALAVTGQQLLAGHGGATGAVVNRALSIDPAEQFGGAASFRDALGRPPSARRRRMRWRIAALLVLLAAAAALLLRRSVEPGVLDPNLVAVAPFEVLDAEHGVWREGLVTVLSANLDGAGPLHTVSPSLVIRGWAGPADIASAIALGKRTGARLVVIGRVVGTGGDTTELSVRVVDAEAGTGMAEIQVRDPGARLDRLADALTRGLLEQLSRSRPISAVRSASLGTGSLAALKAFLEGEQHYRRSEWEPAIESYQRAIGLDSTFALALYRAGLVLGWQRTSGESLSVDYLTRAAQHNRGLPPRDSMLVAAESLTAALDEGPGQAGYWRLYRRLYATTAEATRRYPRDAEVWYEFGDVRYHFPVFSNLREMREAFDRSIELDSAFAPAYIHPVELVSQLDGPLAARRYVERYLALRSNDSYADAMRLTGKLLDPAQAHEASVQSVLDTASSDLLTAAIPSFRGWADSLETSVRLSRVLADGHAAGIAPPSQRPASLRQLGNALAYHGRLKDAWDRTVDVPAAERVLSTAAWMGGVPREAAAPVFEHSLRHDTLNEHSLAAVGAPWFARVGDTTSLRLLMWRADSLGRAANGPMLKAFAQYLSQGTRALAALARGDTTEALRGLLSLPDTACQRCVLFTIQLAELLDARHLEEDAGRLLAGDSPGFVFATDGFWELFRARLAVRAGQRREAAEHYRFVRDTWLHADAVLQPFVREATTYLESKERG